MNLHEFLAPATASTRRSGPRDQIVMSSRVRLARNLRTAPFPGWAKKPERVKVFERLRAAIEVLPVMAGGCSESMENVSALDKQILIERHLISREHAAKGAGSGLVLSRDASFSVMINEEDHLRLQAIQPGYQFREAWAALDAVDTELARTLDYAFSPELGYLTACPTNVGTGIRVSAMLHLPGLVLHEQINPIIQSVNKLGLAVRGFYGEGTEALGNVFQVSNQMTLGESELMILARLEKVVSQLIEHEENARAVLLEQKPKVLFNQTGRAYGILANAHSVSSKEAMNLLSLLLLGIDLGLFPGVGRELNDELFLLIQPAHLQQSRAEKMTGDERDLLRADLLRERLKTIRRPLDQPPAAPGETLDNAPKP
jgi:protein arginine kinase